METAITQTKRSQVYFTVGAAYLAVTLHNAWIASMGGLSKVPMILFGLCQLTPAAVVFLMHREYLPRLKELLTRKVSAKMLLGTYALTAAVLGVCIGLPYALGYLHLPYGAEMTATYPLQRLIPSAFLDPSIYWLYVLLGAPLLHLLTATGEEILWRGLLLDQMLGAFPRKTVYWLNGVFWGLWHTSMIVLLNWDFPGHPVAGVVAITLSQVAWSLVFVELRLRTDSLRPAIVMHTVANAMTIGLYDRMIDHDYNLLFSPWGLTGGALMTLASLVILRRKGT